MTDRGVTQVPGSHWTAVVDADKLADGVPLAVYPLGVGVLLVKQGAETYAVADRCAHMACPLEGGRLEGFRLTCPCHDWTFDVRTGQFVAAPEITITTYPVKVEEGRVLVNIAGEAVTT
jgi:3-phenylpropionate/trans-cinnamate dioxygenase ferredoxin subunit